MKKNRSPLAGLLLAFFAVIGSPLLLQGPANASNSGLIIITEIMYHPSGGGQELEFIEIHNASPAPVDISGWYFSKGISYTFPSSSFLNGGEYAVVCANQDRISEVYGINNIAGNWGLGCDLEGDERDGCALSNSGETIELAEENGVVVATVGYNDRGKWPSGADGTGHSLALIEVYSDPDDPDSWSISGSLGGSPGGPNNPSTDSLTIVVNEALTWTAGERWVELFNLSSQSVNLSEFWISNSRALANENSRFQLPAGTTIGAREHLALSDLQVDIGNGLVAAVGLAEVDCLNNAHRRAFSLRSLSSGSQPLSLYAQALILIIGLTTDPAPGNRMMKRSSLLVMHRSRIGVCLSHLPEEQAHLFRKVFALKLRSSSFTPPDRDYSIDWLFSIY